MATDQKTNMKLSTLIIILTLISVWTFGQTDFTKRNSVYFEIAGSGGIGSINFERLFIKTNNTEFTWRGGLSFAPIDKNNGTGIVFPVMINALIGKNSHKLELGLGQGITVTTRGHFFMLTTAAIGYRYQPSTKKWFYRFTYTPLISYLGNFQIQHWGGLSIGYTIINKLK